MTDSRWPEPSPDPAEPPRLPGWAIAGIIAAALALFVSNSDWRARLPEFALPQFEMPRIAMPGVNTRERPDVISQQAPAEDYAASAAEALFPDGTRDSVQSVPFENCIEMMESSATALGIPAVIEDNADRRVIRYKFLEGSLTVTCTRADNTLRIEQGA
jgi:hypothetical protein